MKLSEAIAALERGEEVEYIGAINSWRPLTFDSGFMLGKAKDYQFRLKPKPVEPVTVWLNFYPDQAFVHTTKARAERDADIHASRIAVPFREVVPLTDEESSRLRDLIQTYKNDRHFTNVSFLLDLLKKQGVE